MGMMMPEAIERTEPTEAELRKAWRNKGFFDGVKGREINLARASSKPLEDAYRTGYKQGRKQKESGRSTEFNIQRPR